MKRFYYLPVVTELCYYVRILFLKYTMILTSHCDN